MTTIIYARLQWPINLHGSLTTITLLQSHELSLLQKTMTTKFVDLVTCPPSNAFLASTQLGEPENYYPLTICVCDNCFLVQVDEDKKAQEIFNSEYVYFSSYSKSWVQHSRRYSENMVQRFGYTKDSLVGEVASDHGYQLQHFKNMGVPVLGIEPRNGAVSLLHLSRR